MEYVVDYTFKNGISGTASIFIPDKPETKETPKSYEKRVASSISIINKLNKILKKQGAVVSWRMEK